MKTTSPGIRCLSTALLFAALLTSCVKYRPRPLDPPALERAHRTCDLTDPGLHSFLAERSLEPIDEWPLTKLNLEILTLVGWYFSPDLAVARSTVQTAEAGVLAAGGRVNPSVSISSGYNSAPESAALLDFLPSFTIETAGKRDKRIMLATEQLEVARLRAEEAAWRVRGQTRSALTSWIAASRIRALLEEEVGIRSEAANMLGLRLQVGEVARPVADAAMQELEAARAALAGAIGQEARTRAVLAAALGLSVEALSDVRIAEPTLDSPPSVDRLSLGRIQRGGLLHRSDIRRALAEYAVAEVTVRLEVARQYPNLQLDPGFVFEEGFVRYVFGFTLAPPLLNRNQGPIAVAEAKRAESEARFKQLQSVALGEMEQALAAYAGAFSELAAAKDRVEAARRVEQASRKSFLSGETDRLAFAIERLLRVAAEQAQQNALLRAQQAFGALEDAVQQPLLGEWRPLSSKLPDLDKPTP